MRNNPAYVPKKRKANYFLVVLLLLVMSVGVYFIYDKYVKEESDDHLYYTFCELTPSETQSILKKQVKSYKKQEKIDFNDYGIYGETLSFFSKPYSAKNLDALSGDTLFLNNLCDTSFDDKTPYLLSSMLDMGIELWQLEDGLYEVEILSDFKYKRLRSDIVFDDIFSTAMRNGQIKEVRLFSDKDILNKNLDHEIVDDQYLFIEVKTVTENDEIDVVLNPAAFNILENGEIGFGSYYVDNNGNEFNEADETYRLAKAVKKELEVKGIRTEILRNDTQPINNFGENGRIQRAYDLNAKYMINMRLELSYSMYDYGVNVLYSNASSNRFASLLANELLTNSMLQESYYSDRSNPPSVFQTLKEDDLDYNDFIRETGGPLLGAGTLKEFKDTKKFMHTQNIGINTVDVLYGYLNDEKDFKAWTKDFDNIAKATAQAILDVMGVD